jgi:hypothetical protein
MTQFDGFKTSIDTDPSFASFAIQQCVAVIVPAVWALLLSIVTEALVRPLLGPTIENMLWNLLVWPSGFVLGLLVRRLFRQAPDTGRWVWLLPFLGFAALFSYSLSREPLGTALKEFFSGSGEGVWIVALLTYPTGFCIGYSLAMLRFRAGTKGTA